MSTRQYIGARYVPKFYQNSVDGSAAWESNVVYEPLTWVTLQNGHIYLSRKQVPATVGIPSQNVDYWLDVGSYNGFIEGLQNQIDAMSTRITGVEENIAIKTPEDFGAVGDGVTDDSQALSDWLNSDYSVLALRDKTYLSTSVIVCNKTHTILGNGGIIKMSENITPSDVYLIHFSGCDNLTLVGVNFYIKTQNSSPYADDNVANHDGILVSTYGCNNLSFIGCSFIVEKGSVTAPITPLWIRGNCNHVYIDGCDIENLGFAQRSGGLWLYGAIYDVAVSNSKIINSTLDEAIINWYDNTTPNDLRVDNCYIESKAKNDQITKTDTLNNYTFNDCTIKFASNVINYRGFKATGGVININNCNIEYHTLVESALFNPSGGKINVADCNIDMYIEDNQNGGLIYGTAGEITVKNCNIVDKGSNRTTLFNTHNTVKMHFISNIFKSTMSGQFGFSHGYDEFYFIDNVINTTSNFDCYVHSTQGSQIKKIFNNIYISGCGSFFNNQNESLKNRSRAYCSVYPHNVAHGGTATFTLPSVTTVSKQVGIAIIQDSDVNWLHEVGVLAVNSNGNWGYNPLVDDTNISVSVSGTTLSATNSSVYGNELSLTILYYEDKNYSN